MGVKFVLGACIVILTVMVAGAVFFVVPPAEGLGNLVRIAFLHIPAAWVSVIAFFMSAWWAAAYLRRGNIRDDARSFSSARLGFVFTLLATVSGAVFSKLTWGAYWNWDPRQTTILVLLLIYGAYLTLRAAMEEYNRRARVSAVYSLFSFLTVPFLVFIVPRLFFSLHPAPVLNGSGSVDMDPVMLVTLFAAAADATLIYIWLLLKSSRKEEKI
ncbi:MAG: cytochrome c biogenesis protein CcsA [Schwartzia sp.]|jgi:heme exporter protein C|nr:cytochrome c biogenesis protein [Schwartzia succinivorans]MBE6098033.1 cytochrome C biogenesis protein [Schwartzia succinivorans]MCR5447737.1 cytochrome c biogenesis protein CcsA [Schwartzia sp. (in: firmicutes)]